MTLTDRRVAEVTITRRSIDGTELSSVTLDPAIFSIPVNVPLLHQVVTAQLAGRRAGTQSTRTRAEVKGGSAKPFRQKGTGNARQGSIRAPHYAGGGIALGPKPRSYAQKTPKKMVRQALFCALSDRAGSGSVMLVDAWSFPEMRTKAAVEALAALGCEGKVLVVLTRDDDLAKRCFSNLAHVLTVPADQLTAYDVLSCDVVVFCDATLPGQVREQTSATASRQHGGSRTAKPAKEDSPEQGAETGPRSASETEAEAEAEPEHSEGANGEAPDEEQQ